MFTGNVILEINNSNSDFNEIKCYFCLTFLKFWYFCIFLVIKRKYVQNLILLKISVVQVICVKLHYFDLDKYENTERHNRYGKKALWYGHWIIEYNLTMTSKKIYREFSRSEFNKKSTTIINKLQFAYITTAWIY